MGTTAQKLKKLLDNKRAIRDAITEKTGEDAGEVMSTYAEKIMAIEGGGAKYFRTTILLDQTITDPATMITKVYDDGGISQIRLNSHRYVCKLVDGVMQAKQLQDNNGTLYLDGTAADLTGAEGDVMMKLPVFYYRARSEETDKWFIDFVYGEMPDESYKVWDGKDFIGVYEAYVSSNNVYSRSGVASTGSVSQANFKTYARNRGEGYTLVKWKHHCIMAFLFYAEYLNTNSQAICGAGTDSYTKTNGQTDLLGMEDTSADVNGNVQSINYFGLENWWGNKEEFIDNATFDNASSVEIIEDNGSSRLALIGNTSGWVKSLIVSSELDATPYVVGASATSGYCDYFYAGAEGHILARSYDALSANGGITHLLGTKIDTASLAYTSRLAYRGEYETFDGVFDAEYETLKYFESYGTEYIDTGFKPTTRSVITQDVQFTNTQSQYCGILPSPYWLYGFGQGGAELYFGSKVVTTSVPITTERMTVEFNAPYGVAAINGVAVCNSTVSATSGYSYLLLALRRSQTVVDGGCNMKLYSCQIYDNGTLVRDFIPCVRKADGVRGLWDKVNKTFITPTSI